MKITRRELLRLSVSLAALQIASWPAQATPDKPEWRDLCKAWMELLMPSDGKGPDINDPLIWENLDKLMRNEPQFESSLESGILNLAEVELPASDSELESIVNDPNHSAFVYGFINLLIEQFYSCELGWKDLGIEGPLKPI